MKQNKTSFLLKSKTEKKSKKKAKSKTFSKKYWSSSPPKYIKNNWGQLGHLEILRTHVQTLPVSSSFVPDLPWAE